MSSYLVTAHQSGFWPQEKKIHQGKFLTKKGQEPSPVEAPPETHVGERLRSLSRPAGGGGGGGGGMHVPAGGHLTSCKPCMKGVRLLRCQNAIVKAHLTHPCVPCPHCSHPKGHSALSLSAIQRRTEAQAWASTQAFAACTALCSSPGFCIR